jgi:hypothetical protein
LASGAWGGGLWCSSSGLGDLPAPYLPPVSSWIPRPRKLQNQVPGHPSHCSQQSGEGSLAKGSRGMHTFAPGRWQPGPPVFMDGVKCHSVCASVHVCVLFGKHHIPDICMACACVPAYEYVIACHVCANVSVGISLVGFCCALVNVQVCCSLWKWGGYLRQ